MHQSKFSLADLLIVLGAIGFGFFCFLSFNFLSFGDTIPSIIWSIAFAIILAGLALGAKLLKKTSRNFKTCIIWEWILLVLFMGAACVATFPFSHYFSVSAQKEGIQQKIIANLTQAEGMFNDYERYANTRLNIYKSRLNSVVSGKTTDMIEYKNYGFVNDISDSTQVENKIFTLKAQLFPSNYHEIKSVDSTWLTTAKNTVANWKAIGIVSVIKEVKKNLTTWKNELKQFSSFRAKGEAATDFDYSLTFDYVEDKFTEVSSPTAISIIIAFLLYVLMLLSYFMAARHTKFPGIKLIFQKLDNKRTIINH